MKISILHTTARPYEWRATYDAWIAAAAHPENVEYVLCVDGRWGFPQVPGADSTLVQWTSSRGVFDGFALGNPAGERNQLCVNRHAYRHSGYVSGVNECAKHSTGDVLVVIADDFFPCPKWDEEIIDAWRRATTPGRPDFQGNIAPAECVIWCPTNTPQEFERNIMVAPILFRSRYDRLGYVFYPSYESMYADNDFAEHAQFDYREGRCVIIIGNFVLEHRHPFFQPEKMDDAYRAGNHPEAYELGRKLLDARRACNFGDVQQIEIPKRRIAICYLGETFPLRWVQAFSDLLAKLGFVHDVQIFSGYSTQVYLGRAAHAKGVLEMLMDQDYILWIDDDNPPFPDQVDQLLADLEARPEIGMVAGWTMTLSDCASFGGIVEGKRIDADVATFLTQGPDLQRIAWTGFPMVLMRYALLKDVGYRAFLPIQEGSESGNHLAFGWLGEDIGFCKVAVEKGWALFVDRRVRLEHLKTVDICASYRCGDAYEVERSAPSAGAGQPSVLGSNDSGLPACPKPNCALNEDHLGSCYPGTANAAPTAEPIATESKQ